MEDKPFQYCSEAECYERQELGQVNELEATIETCTLPQAERILDPRYAVTKYRRSAAGGGVGGSTGGTVDRVTSTKQRRTASQLSSTLRHLMYVAAYHQATSDHPRVTNVSTVLSFLIDRLRSCQADATRLSSGCGNGSDRNTNNINYVPSVWHLKLLRLLIWIKFCWDLEKASSATKTSSNNNNASDDSLTPRTLQTMVSTAIDMYWSTREVDLIINPVSNERQKQMKEDDEVLCYTAMLRISAISITTICSSSSSSMSQEASFNGILLEFNKRHLQLMTARRRSNPYSCSKPADSSSTTSLSFPLWHAAFRVASYVSRQDFVLLFNAGMKSSIVTELPILARCCCAPVALFAWRYRTVQQYNVSFAKNEVVHDLDRLLGINRQDWTIEFASEFGAPVSLTETERGDGATISSIAVTMKSVAIPDLDVSKSELNHSEAHVRSTRKWIFGELFNAEESMGILSFEVLRLVDSESVIPTTDNAAGDNDNAEKPFVSSLQQQLERLSIKEVRTKTQNVRRPTSIDSGRKRQVKCKFHAQGNCRYGDTCRFEHSS
jgi:SAC3/GANP family/CCCH-type zinc finger